MAAVDFFLKLDGIDDPTTPEGRAHFKAVADKGGVVGRPVVAYQDLDLYPVLGQRAADSLAEEIAPVVVGNDHRHRS